MGCSFFINAGGISDGGGGTPSDILVINSLYSPSTENALSAGKGQELRIMVEGVQANLTSHIEDDVASTTEYGHVKIDGVTIKINENGQLYTESSGDGTVKSVNDILPDLLGNVEIPVATTTIYGITKLHDVVDDSDNVALTPSAVKKYIEELSGELVKEEFVFDGLSGNPIILEFTPEIVNDDFISIVFQNTIKALPDKYTIVPKDALDLSKGYIFTYNGSAGIINLVLISGYAVGSGSPSDISLHHVVDDTDNKAVTPKAVKDYIDDLKSNLTKEGFIFRPTYEGQTDFAMPQIYQDNPQDYIDLLFYNTTKLHEDEYSIVDVGGVWTIRLNEPVDSSFASYIFNLVLIGGMVINSGASDIPIQDRSQVYRNIPVGATSLPINVVGFNPSKHLVLLFNLRSKMLSDEFDVVPSANSTSGYEIIFTPPIENMHTRFFEIDIV